MKKSFVKRYIWNKYALGVFIILAIGLYFVLSGNKNDEAVDFAEAAIGNVIEQVSVTGKILPVDKVDMAFERSGTVRRVNVSIGDMVKKGQVLASLESASEEANLRSAQAKLADITRDLTPAERLAEQSKVNAASVSLANAERDALEAARTSYNQAFSAVTNNVDVLFSNPQSVNPTIKIRTESSNEEMSINTARALVSEAFTTWKKDIDASSDPDSALELLGKTQKHLDTVKSFMDRLSRIVNNLLPGNSGVSQTTIDGYISSVTAGQSSLSTAISSISTSLSTLRNASSSAEQAASNYELKNSGSSPEAVAAQTAAVSGYQAELDKTRIVAPMDGLVTKVNPTAGEYVTAGQTQIGVMSDGIYKIEAFVPEADIAKVKIGDRASTTLDAYGQNVDFPASVTRIDPAETVIEGVPTYKVTLLFTDRDDRIRSGMTANLEILTGERKDVLAIPYRAIMDEDGRKTVRLLDAKGEYSSVPVAVGLKGSDGKIEIVSGLSVGDKVVTYIK